MVVLAAPLRRDADREQRRPSDQERAEQPTRLTPCMNVQRDAPDLLNSTGPSASCALRTQLRRARFRAITITPVAGRFAQSMVGGSTSRPDASHALKPPSSSTMSV